jgi:hypothetical protein
VKQTRYRTQQKLCSASAAQVHFLRWHCFHATRDKFTLPRWRVWTTSCGTRSSRATSESRGIPSRDAALTPRRTAPTHERRSGVHH